MKRLLKCTLMKQVWETLGYNLLYLPGMYFLAWVIDFGWFATHHYCSKTFLNTSFLPPSHGHNVLESRDTALCSTALQDNAQCWNVAITEDTGHSAVVSRSWLLSLAHNPLCSRKDVSILLSATAKEVVTNIWTYSVGRSCSNIQHVLWLSHCLTCSISGSDCAHRVTDVSIKTFSLQYQLNQKKYWVPICSFI